MKAFTINGFKIQAVDAKDAMKYVWFAWNERSVMVTLTRDGQEMKIKLNIRAEDDSPYLEDIIGFAVGNQLEFIGVEFDAYEVHTLDGTWLSSSEL